MSTTTTNATLTDETIQLVDDALNHFRENADPNNAEAEIWHIVEFVTNIVQHPEDGASLFLEYVSPDPVKGREIVDKLGVYATFGDLDAAIKNGTIKQ
jgi:hypothetical protein